MLEHKVFLYKINFDLEFLIQKMSIYVEKNDIFKRS
jgi:hypothetical protein